MTLRNKVLECMGRVEGADATEREAERQRQVDEVVGWVQTWAIEKGLIKRGEEIEREPIAA